MTLNPFCFRDPCVSQTPVIFLDSCLFQELSQSLISFSFRVQTPDDCFLHFQRPRAPDSNVLPLRMQEPMTQVLPVPPRSRDLDPALLPQTHSSRPKAFFRHSSPCPSTSPSSQNSRPWSFFSPRAPGSHPGVQDQPSFLRPRGPQTNHPSKDLIWQFF